jgi:hypothetical protein
MVNDPVLVPIRRCGERRMTNPIHLLTRVLVENRIRVLAPVARVHGVGTHKLQLSKTVVAVVGAGGAV